MKLVNYCPNISMERMFMDTESSKNNEPHRCVINLSQRFEVAELVLVRCDWGNNQYQQKSEVLNTFTLSKSHAYLLNVEQSNLVLLRTHDKAVENNPMRNSLLIITCRQWKWDFLIY